MKWTEIIKMFVVDWTIAGSDLGISALFCFKDRHAHLPEIYTLARDIHTHTESDLWRS